MRKNLMNRWVVAALVTFTALPIAAHAEDKMMSKDKMSGGTMMSKDKMSGGSMMSKDKMMMNKSGMTMKQKKMMEKDAMGMSAMQKQGMMKMMMMNKMMMKKEMNRVAWYKKQYGTDWRSHYMPGK